MIGPKIEDFDWDELDNIDIDDNGTDEELDETFDEELEDLEDINL